MVYVASTTGVGDSDELITLESLKKLEKDVFIFTGRKIVAVVIGRKDMEAIEDHCRPYCEYADNKQFSQFIPMTFGGIGLIPVEADHCMEEVTKEEIEECRRIMKRFKLENKSLGVLLVIIKRTRRGKYNV